MKFCITFALSLYVVAILASPLEQYQPQHERKASSSLSRGPNATERALPATTLIANRLKRIRNGGSRPTPSTSTRMSKRGLSRGGLAGIILAGYIPVFCFIIYAKFRMCPDEPPPRIVF
ncbi:hypothetical protein BDZ45DRAFT_751800 [Acephala macrosclerotiorum]|nr:hypothetical protein BDZ45DRAFT_751800 [Acephala macrosclerotiorum]